MENAAKALTIAGGILISIIVIATLVYALQEWRIFPTQQDKSEENSQIIAFNKEFESYNKQNLYGTDVLTVINKAMNNNEKYGVTSDTENPYFVNVIVETKIKADGKKLTKERKTDGTVSEKIEIYDPTGLQADTYQLKNSADFVKLFNLCKEVPVKVEKKGANITIEYYTSANEFRLKYFTCTSIKKNSVNGRICEITFTEIAPEATLYPVK